MRSEITSSERRHRGASPCCSARPTGSSPPLGTIRATARPPKIIFRRHDEGALDPRLKTTRGPVDTGLAVGLGCGFGAPSCHGRVWYHHSKKLNKDLAKVRADLQDSRTPSSA